MSGKGWAEEILPKTRNEFIVAIFFLKGLENLSHGVMNMWELAIMSYNNLVVYALISVAVIYQISVSSRFLMKSFL